ncbi:ArsA family ATPase [Persicimonas caeni]|uniref:ArsA family ATPase n=1 Tax=Persicimonas caeni TaxID=2292766 RepID=UPI00143CF692|nr:ArsA family ATPase [Persicimonas caeni]
MSLQDQRFVLFSGKGGVGKTVISSAYALSCARRGERTLLMELNVKDKVSSFFGSSSVGSDIVEVEDNLFAVNVTPDAALEEYGLMILKVKLIYKAVFENRIISSFLRSIPGLNDLLMLGKAYFHATEVATDGSYVWDKVVVDAPATGHGLFFLQIPSVITGFISSGHMYEEAKRIQDLLQDPAKTALNLVTLPEEMPVNETLMMRDELQERMGLATTSIIANGVYPPLFSQEQYDWIDEARDAVAPDSELLGGFLDAASFRGQRVDLQNEYLERLENEVDLPLYYVPYHFTDRVTFPVISKIADQLAAQISGEQEPTALSAQ